MSLRFNCSNCETEVVVKYLKIGESAKCPHCGQNITIPANAIQTEQDPEYLVKPNEDKLEPQNTTKKLNIRNIQFTSRNISIAISLLLWFSIIVFIVYLYNISLLTSPLWNYRYLILYGFTIIGGITAGIIGEKNGASILVGVFTFIFFLLTNYLWNEKTISIHNWRILIIGLGFLAGKLINAAIQGKIKLERIKKIRKINLKNVNLLSFKTLISFILLIWVVCIAIMPILMFIDLSTTPLRNLRPIFLVIFLSLGGFVAGIVGDKKILLGTIPFTFGFSRLAYFIWYHNFTSNLVWHAIIIISGLIIGMLIPYKVLQKDNNETGSTVKPPSP